MAVAGPHSGSRVWRLRSDQVSRVARGHPERRRVGEATDDFSLVGGPPPRKRACRFASTAAPLSAMARSGIGGDGHQAFLPGVAQEQHVGVERVAHERRRESLGIEEIGLVRTDGVNDPLPHQIQGNCQFGSRMNSAVGVSAQLTTARVCASSIFGERIVPAVTTRSPPGWHGLPRSRCAGVDVLGRSATRRWKRRRRISGPDRSCRGPKRLYRQMGSHADKAPG